MAPQKHLREHADFPLYPNNFAGFGKPEHVAVDNIAGGVLLESFSDHAQSARRKNVV